MRIRLVINAMLCTVLIVAVSVQSSPAETPIIKLISQMADTPADHKALAEYYRAKAEDARAEIALHESMKASYTHRGSAIKNSVDFSSSMKKHCTSLIESYKTAAESYESLSNMHIKEAMGR